MADIVDAVNAECHAPDPLRPGRLRCRADEGHPGRHWSDQRKGFIDYWENVPPPAIPPALVRELVEAADEAAGWDGFILSRPVADRVRAAVAAIRPYLSSEGEK